MASRGKRDSGGPPRQPDERVPVPVRILISTVGLLLVGIAVESYVLDHPSGGGPMLTAGVLLFVIGPVINRLTSFELGPEGFKAKMTDAFVAGQQVAGAEAERAEGDVHKVAPSSAARGGFNFGQGAVSGSRVIDFGKRPAAADEGTFATGGESFDFGKRPTAADEEIFEGGEDRVAAAGTGVAPGVEVTDSASKVIEQLSKGDKTAVQSVIEQMMSLEDHGGVLLPGSTVYWVREVNDHIRLVYRLRNQRRETDPRGFVILNVVRPGSSLWRMTDYAL